MQTAPTEQPGATLPPVLTWINSIVSVLGARSFAAAAAFLGNVLVARQLGDERFSQFYLLFSIMTIVAGLTGPAIDTSLVRFASKRIGPEGDDSAPYFKAVLYLKIGVLMLTMAVWLVSVRPILRTFFEWTGEDPDPVRWFYVLLAFVGGAAVSMWGFAQSYFQAHQRFTHYAGYEFCSSLLRLGLVFGLLGLGSVRVVPYLSVYVIAPLTMGILAWSQLPPSIFRAATSLRVIRELLSFGKWVLLATIFTTIAQRMDIILLNYDVFNISKDVVGRYSAAVSIVLAGELVLLTFYSVLLPKASALKETWELRAFIGQFRIPSMLFCLVMTLTIPVMPYFRAIALGPEYEGAETYYSILILGVVVALGCAPTVTALYAMGHSRTVAAFEGLRLLLTVVLGYWVVPRYGVWGMAMVMAGVRAGVSIITYLVAHQTVKRASIAEAAETEA